MNLRISNLTIAWGFAWSAIAGTASVMHAQATPESTAIRAADEDLVKAFNANSADQVAALFLPQGELIDEHGTVYQGQAEVKELLTSFFSKFPGAKIALEVESIRVIGPLAIEEGTRHTTTKDGGDRAQVRYVAVRTKVGNAWPLASVRDFHDPVGTTPHDNLQSLAWLVGNWVNESSDAAVKISFRWSEDKNFLLGDYQVSRGGEQLMKSEQRIGWDPLAGKVVSWMFDSDGGYAQGTWTPIDDSWVVKSSAVMPDGQTGSATVTMTPQDKGRFVMRGTERIVGDVREEDFEITAVRSAPQPSK